MKLAQHDNKLESNVKTVSQDFGIGDASVVIEILRNRLYEHKVRTLVQEYMCNARDASREVASNKRIIVSVPNRLSPVFKVRDFGPGITPDRMANVFTKYGASTKRNSNGQTGGFGIGAKSAWSYTDSFTIVSITEGTKRTYVAHTGVSNQGRLDLLAEISTDEETGTEIQIAIKPDDSRDFKNSILRASYFWKSSERPEFRGITVGEESFHTPGLMIGKHLEVIKTNLPDFLDKSYHDKSGMVIDGIFYSITDKLSNKINSVSELYHCFKTFSLLHVGNGIVEVGANRESIADSEYTRDQLVKLTNEAREDFIVYIKNAFKAAKTNAEWLTTYKELDLLGYVDEYSQFGNYKIDRGGILSEDFGDISMVHVTNNYRSQKVKLTHSITPRIYLNCADAVYYIDNEKESTVTQNKRIREFFEKNRKANLILVYAKEVIGFDNNKKDAAGQPLKIVTTSLTQSKKVLAKIIKDFTAKPLSSLPYTLTVRVPKAKRDRTKEMFTVHTAKWGGKSPETITLERAETSGKTYLYVKFEQFDSFKEEMSDMYSYLANQNLRLCYLTEKSIEMVEGSKFFKRYQDWKSDFSPNKKTIDAVKSIKALNYNIVKFLSKAESKIKDKHIVKMLKEYDGIGLKTDSIPETIQKIVSKDLASFIEEDKELTRLVKECYPLVGQVATDYANKTLANEIVIYINAKN